MPSPRLASLRHPGWWCALAVLVLNDHVLKHAFPSALTGKVSDVAGLIVAPVLVAALFGARSLRGRAMAFAACAVPFAAINLSPAIAAHWDALLGWSTTTDPTDLAALLIAPVALRIAAYQPPPAREWAPRLGAVLGGLACLATAPVEPLFTTAGGPLLENGLDEEITVRVRWLDAGIDCSRLSTWMTERDDEALARALDPALFGTARTFRLDPLESADLTRPADTESSTRGSAAHGRCDALILGADGLEPQLVAYFESEWNVNTLTFAPAGDSIRLTAAGGTLMRATPTPTIEPAACERTEPAVFSWSGTAPRTAYVQGYETLSDGCFVLELADGLDLPVDTEGDTEDPTEPPRLDPLEPEIHALTICAPRERFDFAIDEELYVELRPDEISLTGDRHGVRMQRLAALAAIDESQAERVCEGERLACGGYVEPIGWFGGALVPGAPNVAEGRTQRVTRLLDDAVHVVAAHDDCGLELGLRGVLLTHWEEYE